MKLSLNFLYKRTDKSKLIQKNKSRPLKTYSKFANCITCREYKKLIDLQKGFTSVQASLSY